MFDGAFPVDPIDSAVELRLPDGLAHTMAKSTGTGNKYTICQYTGCSSATGDSCKLPFKYKGRTYDTCITIDDKGSYPGAPWCSRKLDIDGNHLNGNEITCSESCRVSNCPVGYYRMADADTCYRVSTFKGAVKYKEIVSSNPVRTDN